MALTDFVVHRGDRLRLLRGALIIAPPAAPVPGPAAAAPAAAPVAAGIFLVFVAAAAAAGAAPSAAPGRRAATATVPAAAALLCRTPLHQVCRCCLETPWRLRPALSTSNPKP